MPSKPSKPMLFVLAQLAVMLPLALGHAEEDPFATRKYDVIYTRVGVVYKGTILSEEGENIRIRLDHGNAVMPVQRSDIKKILRRASPEDAVKQALEEDLNNPVALAKTARKALERFKGNRTVAAIVLKTAEQAASSGDPDLLALLAEMFLEMDNPIEAEKMANALIAKKDSATARLLKGKALHAQGKGEEALVEVKQAQTLEPAREDVLVLLAELQLALGRPELASRVFTDALANNPRQVGALIGKGTIQLRQGEFDPAVESFEKALGVEASNPDALIGLAACRLVKKEYDEAMQLADRVLSRDVTSARAYGIQGYALLLRGKADQPAEALQKINESLNEDKNNIRMKVIKAVALHRQAEIMDLNEDGNAAQNRTDAKNLMTEVGAQVRDDSWLQYFFAERYYQISEAEADADRRQKALDEALKGFSNAVKLAPRYAPAHRAVGAVALKMRKWSEAEEAYSKAIELDEKNAEYHAGLGLALLGKKQLQTALTKFKRALELEGANVAALCGLGYISNFEKNERAAKHFFQQALAADGRCAYAANALKMLYAQRNLELQYLTFNNGDEPGWRAGKGTGLLARVEDGKIRWRGTMGGAASQGLEYMTDITAGDFERIEADLEIAHDCPATLVLRLASRKGSAVNFFVEFGKDDTGRLSYRFRDYSGVPPDWRSVQPWPLAGKMRLAIEARDLNSGLVGFYVNGVEKGSLQLQLKQPSTIAVGVSLAASSREVLNAAVDNISLLLRGRNKEEATHRPGDLIPPEESKGKE